MRVTCRIFLVRYQLEAMKKRATPVIIEPEKRDAQLLSPIIPRAASAKAHTSPI